MRNKEVTERPQAGFWFFSLTFKRAVWSFKNMFPTSLILLSSRDRAQCFCPWVRTRLTDSLGTREVMPDIITRGTLRLPHENHHGFCLAISLRSLIAEEANSRVLGNSGSHGKRPMWGSIEASVNSHVETDPTVPVKF